jgi:hypothetical protein
VVSNAVANINLTVTAVSLKILALMNIILTVDCKQQIDEGFMIFDIYFVAHGQMVLSFQSIHMTVMT